MSFSITKIPRVAVAYLHGPNGIPQYIADPTVTALQAQIPVWLQIRLHA